ncbi:MAG: YIP1 family protein [Pseudomonadota bacterium]|uniref:YIP1 family protein n=1 Tax=uncultured Arenimonas sp. TaxID=546226 RepID=UPI0030D8700F
MSHLINIFLEPAKVFADLREKPTFWVPMLLLAVLTAVSTLLYFLNVDPAWFAEYQSAQMLLQNPEMTSAELAQMQSIMPGARAMGWFAAVGALLVIVVVFLVYGVYYLLAGKITGQPVGFRHGLALVSWSSMPMVLGSLVVIGAVLTSSPQASLESMQLTNIDPLLVQLPMDHDWSLLARSFSLLNFWVWFLAALGWKTWFRTGWGQALVVVLLPSIVIYGVMALFAIL